jgi:hypothetical protein
VAGHARADAGAFGAAKHWAHGDAGAHTFLWRPVGDGAYINANGQRRSYAYAQHGGGNNRERHERCANSHGYIDVNQTNPGSYEYTLTY